MDYKLYQEKDYKISNWTGGKTSQLSIFPENNSYTDREFIWRLSSATCEKEESQFSKLTDYDRVLLVLEGDVVLAHQDVRVARLAELEQDRFDGAYSTKSFGKITDYNLMVKKGNQGFLEVLTLSSESSTLQNEDYPDYSLLTQGFYCRDGFAAVSVNGEIVMLKPEQQLIINYKRGEKVEISVMGEGNLIRAQIFYDYIKEEMEAEEIPREKATFGDFLTCIYLANSQFRGASLIFKRIKSEWIDQQLSAAIRKIEGFYLSFIILIAGIAVVTYIGIDSLEGVQWLWALMTWVIVDMFIITPLMYFAVVPKPTARHIKKIDDLTPYERKVMEEEAMTNERVERILKKYKHSGRAVYDEDGNRLDRTF